MAVTEVHLAITRATRAVPAQHWLHQGNVCGLLPWIVQGQVRAWWVSLVAQLVKNLPAIWETWVQSLGWEDTLEKGMATHSSILAWRIQWPIPWGCKESDATFTVFCPMQNNSSILSERLLAFPAYSITIGRLTPYKTRVTTYFTYLWLKENTLADGIVG